MATRINDAHPCEIFRTLSGEHHAGAHGDCVTVGRNSAPSEDGSFVSVGIYMCLAEAKELHRALGEAIACTQEYQDAQTEAQAASDEVTP